jgi:hypothetical protein
MFPLTNLHSGESVDFVPDDNIVNNLEELCIRRSNLKFAKFHKSWANAKKSAIRIYLRDYINCQLWRKLKIMDWNGKSAASALPHHCILAEST